MTPVSGYAAHDAASALVPFHFERRALRPNDVSIDILYCGVCHTDLHHARDHWHHTIFPVVPGHEIVGRVAAVGSGVRSFGIGDHVAVGCMVDSCQECDQCRRGMEQMCRKGLTVTYNDRDRQTGDITYGGYSNAIVVREEFVLRVPKTLDISRVAPLLCAGITTYSPMREWKIGPGSRLAVIGLGGLGHMAVKIGAALGAEVTVVTSTPAKRKDALGLGAHHSLLSADAAALKASRSSYDLVLDTIPVPHDITLFLSLLDVESTYCLVGAADAQLSIPAALLLDGRKRVTGSPIGGLRETQILLDLCAAKNVLPECESIAMKDINLAFDRMERNDVKYRFVIDMATLAADSN